jgi:ribosomal protein S18 acetylase RimI-like enzyme
VDHRLIQIDPDDRLFLDWCGVWAAAQLADRPGEAPRGAADHVALGRELLADGGSRTGTHRAAVVDGAVAGALRVILPLRDNVGVAVLDLAVHPDHRRRGVGTALVRALAVLAREHGCHGMWVGVDAGDEPALATYRRAGADSEAPSVVLAWDLARPPGPSAG